MQAVKAYKVIAAVAALIFFIGLIPYLWAAPQAKVVLYYGSLFFAVLLGASAVLLVLVAPRSTSDREQRDYRVVHFTLRLALTFGIGAVVIGVLLVVSQLLF